jgi:hypothetical protein
MTLRSPQTQKGNFRDSALDYEIVQEQALALGRLGRALEAALRNLSAFDASEGSLGNAADGQASASPTSPTARTRLVEDAGYALWCFIVQREACGLRDQAIIVREYRVPAEVRNRVGVFAGGHRRANR